MPLNRLVSSPTDKDPVLLEDRELAMDILSPIDKTLVVYDNETQMISTLALIIAVQHVRWRCLW